VVKKALGSKCGFLGYFGTLVQIDHVKENYTVYYLGCKIRVCPLDLPQRVSLDRNRLVRIVQHKTAVDLAVAVESS
jgi:hypothetical protein